MAPRGVDQPIADRTILISLMLVGLALRLEVAAQDLFADELATYWIVRSGGLAHVVETVSTTAEISPPLSFILAWLAGGLGDSPMLIRLPALVAGITSIPLVYAVGTRTIGRGAALLAATLTTFSPFMIYYSADARGYGVLVALVLLSTLALLRGIDDGGTRWWVLYAVATCLAAYTHYTGAFVLALQLAWALTVHPRARRPALLATAAAAAAYLPWLPSLRGDLSSPTTRVLGLLSPTDRGSVVSALEQWSIGFPAAGSPKVVPYSIAGASPIDLPGPFALALLGTSLCLSVAGLISQRSPASERSATRDWRILLVVVLAAATPVGTALQSALGTNVFRTRSLAPSWPFLALATAALIAAGPTVLRRVAAALIVVAFGIGAATMRGPDFQRPDFGAVTQLAEERSVGVIVNAATWTPGPLTNFEVEGSSPEVEVLRLTVPEQMDEPFWFGQEQPDPSRIARRAVATAGDRPILLVAFVPELPAVEAFLEHLPEGYELIDTKVMPGIFRMQARVYERSGAGQ